MIISQTPTRISFLGGGTDYPDFFHEHGGETLATSIDKYTYITLNRATQFSDYRYKINYSRLEIAKTHQDILHPPTRECLKYLDIQDSLEIHYASDLPARTGLGSSSSATVCLLTGLHHFKNQMLSTRQIADEAIYIEQKKLNERVGCQDQYSCAMGGFRHFSFHPNGTITSVPLAISLDTLAVLKERLMLFYTDIQRTAHEVVKEQLENTKNKSIEQQLLSMKALVPDAINALLNPANLANFGEVLHEGWKLKREFSNSISNSTIDLAYEKARKAGAVGGKLLGAGGGGFLLLYVEPYLQKQVREALKPLRETKFAFEQHGTRVIFYQPE